MMPDLHIECARAALEGLSLSNDEVATGAIANDLCGLTNEYMVYHACKIYKSADSGKMAKRVLSHSALYHSHSGDLVSLHAMAKAADEPATTTADEVRRWFEFFNGVALGAISFNPNDTVGSDGTPIDPLFAELHIDYEQLFDSSDMDTIRPRAAGMMLHLIHDSFTSSHCQRNTNLEIEAFYHYDLQDKDKHRAGDEATRYDGALRSECEKCVKSLLLDRKPYDFENILKLSPSARPSDSGGF